MKRQRGGENNHDHPAHRRGLANWLDVRGQFVASRGRD